MPQDPDLVQRYLKQTQELFGDTLYLDKCVHIQPELDLVPGAEMSLSSYHDQIKHCQKCELGSTRNHFVFGDGNENADLVFVGEAPGKQEDLLGIPFVGRAGKLLDNILRAIDLERSDIYICNVLKCRPPNNRDPLAGEIELCEPYLQTQLELIKPKVIITLGRIAARTLLRLDLPLGKMRNNTYKYHGIDTVVTYHPAALLRNPNFKKPAWEDFQRIRDTYLLNS